MTPPRETVAVRFVRRIRCRRTSSCPSAAPCRQLAAAATRLRQPLNGGHRRQCLSRLDYIPDCYSDVVAVLARMRLRGPFPAPVEQDGDGPTFVTG